MNTGDPIVFRMRGDSMPFGRRCIWVLPDSNKETCAIAVMEVSELEADGMRTVTGKVIEIIASMPDAVMQAKLYADQYECDRAFLGDSTHYASITLLPRRYEEGARVSGPSWHIPLPLPRER